MGYPSTPGDSASPGAFFKPKLGRRRRAKASLSLRSILRGHSSQPCVFARVCLSFGGVASSPKPGHGSTALLGRRFVVSTAAQGFSVLLAKQGRIQPIRLPSPRLPPVIFQTAAVWIPGTWNLPGGVRRAYGLTRAQRLHRSCFGCPKTPGGVH